MKTFLSIILSCAIVGIVNAQLPSDYNACGTFNILLENATTTPEGLNLDVDGDNDTDIQFVYGVNPDYGKMLYVTTPNPMTGEHTPGSIAFRKTSWGVLERYQFNEPIEPGLNNMEYYGGTAVLYAESGFLNEFDDNSTGYFVYRQDRGYIPPNEPFADTTFYFCMGWVKMQIGTNYNNATLVSSCGCSYSNMVTGQSLPTDIKEEPTTSEVYAIIDGATLLINNLTPFSYDFNLYTLTGKLVFKGKSIQGLKQFDVSNISPGMYILKYSNGKAVRLVK